MNGLLRLILKERDESPLRGTVRVRMTHHQLPQLIDEEFDASKPILIKGLHTDPRGSYQLEVYRGNECLVNQRITIQPRGETLLEIGIADAARPKDRIVEGRVLAGRPPGPAMGNVDVEALDRDFLRPQFDKSLGRNTTDREGRYAIAYSSEDLARPGKRSPDLVVRAYSPQGAVLGETVLGRPAKQHETNVDLIVEAREDRAQSEYEGLQAAIAPIIRDVAVSELTARDVAYLAGQLGGESSVNERRLWLVVESAKLRRDTALPAELFYGVSRMRGSEPPLSVGTFLASPVAALRDAAVCAIEQNIVPSNLRESLNDILARLEALRFERGFAARRGLTGRLVNDQTNEPLAGYRVHAVRVDVDGGSQDLGVDESDGDGVFAVFYAAAADDVAPVRVRLHVVAGDGEEILRQEVEAGRDQSEVIELRVVVPAVPDSPAIPLSDLATISNGRISPGLLGFLTASKINTLADVRRLGGLRRLDRLPVPADDPAVQLLEAHTNLSLLSADPMQNQKLIARGFSSVLSIADSSRAAFVGAVHEELGDFKAAQLHVRATAQAKFLNHVLLGLQAEFVNGFSSSIPGITNPAVPELFEEKCACKDCEAAVGPLAYLADLLAYATKHLVAKGKKVDIDWLAGSFHQPFGDLPVACEAMDKKVRQVRLCVEVLRSDLKPILATLPASKKALLAQAEKAYRLQAYAALLRKSGTSYAEIRLARTAGADDRAALATRLGIELTSAQAGQPAEPDELDRLYLVESPTIVPMEVLTETALEELFGLADTNRDVLCEGLKLGDAKNQIARWNLDRVEWGHDTDAEGTIYLRVEKLGSEYGVKLYRDQARKQLVASGHRSTPSGPITVVAANDGELSGTFTIAFTANSDDVAIVAIPRFLSWRLKHLRTLWLEQDRPIDAYNTDVAAERLPVTDPDLIGPDDFRNPVDDDPAFVLWSKRRQWVDARLEELVALKKPLTDASGQPVVDDSGATIMVPALGKMLERMYEGVTYETTKTPWVKAPQGSAPSPAEFETLYERLTIGSTSDDVEEAKAIIVDHLRLTPESFTRLIEIRRKDTLAVPGNEHEPVSDEEWREARSIVVQAQKRTFFDAWIAEENPDPPSAAKPAITLSATRFWTSVRNPSEGSWPPALSNAQLTKKEPIIDPPALGLKDLPESTAGAEAIRLWEARRHQLDQIRKTLKAKQDEGVVAVITEALGKPPTPPGDWHTYLDALTSELNNSDLTVVAGARKKLEQLGLTEDAFLRLTEITAKTPTIEEWNEVFDILTEARKRTTLFEPWIKEETVFWTEQQKIAYWRVRKARLPRWRASAEARQAWQQALRARSGPPIVDPDVIDIGYLRGALTGTGDAVQIWKSRQKEVDGLLNEVKGAAKTLEGFDATLEEILFEALRSSTKKTIAERRKSNGLAYVLTLVFGDPLPDFAALQSTLNTPSAPEDVAEARRTITEALFLTIERFDTLADIEAKHGAGQLVTPAEWEALDDLLTRAYLLGSLIRLDDEREQGSDIRPRLEQLTLTREAFDRLIALRQLVARAAPLVGEEWADFHAILTQVSKGREFATWREVERAKGITLGPDHFRFPVPPPPQFPPPQPAPLPPWRATRRDRREWEDTLESRIEQVSTTIESAQTVVGETEEETLSSLRDALVDAAVQGDKTFDEKAKWVTDHLLIDARAGGCQLTTRVSQAIETLQGVIWSTSTGQLQDTYPKLVLDADAFEEEWEWIGSYATWRSAMFVFLYPENILLPTLRKRRTPTFTRLVNDTRGGRRLTPESACQAAKAYSDYFRDVCTIDVKATCQTRTRLHRGDCRDRVDAGESYLFYMFGRGNANPRTVYWSAYDPGNSAAKEAQTFWEPLPGMTNVTEIIGAVPYDMGSANRHIFLFVKTTDQKLAYSRYDLEKQEWESEPSGELELPGDVASCRVVVVQRASEVTPIELAVSSGDSVYVRALNSDASDWKEAVTDQDNNDDDEWKPFRVQGDVHDLFAVLDDGKFVHICYAGQSPYDKEIVDHVHVRSAAYGPHGLYHAAFVWIADFAKDAPWPIAGWIGIVPWNNKVYYLFRAGALHISPTASVVAVEVSKLGLGLSDIETQKYDDSNDLESFPPTCGSAPLDQRQVLCNLHHYLPEPFLCKVKEVDGLARFTPDPRVRPAVSGPFDIVEQLPGPTLQERRQEIATASVKNETGLRSNLTYVEEAYFFVPIHLALELQKAGQFEAALNWFRSVYVYGVPKPFRKIYYGLKREESLKAVYERAGDWLLDPLNPHAIASSRKNVYTRFTLLSLARCFLEYGDAEFTLDTPESVPRARTLYMTALELLDLPELKQELAGCEKVSVALDVGDQQSAPQTYALQHGLAKINKKSVMETAVLAVNDALGGDETWDVRFSKAADAITRARLSESPASSLNTWSGERSKVLEKAHAAIVADGSVAVTTTKVGQLAARDFLQSVSGSSRDPTTEFVFNEIFEFSYAGEENRKSKKKIPHQKKRAVPESPVPAPAYGFCIPPNPVIEGLRLHAHLNLYKIRTCRNIAGDERQLEPYAAPTDTVSGMPQIGAAGQLVLPGTITLQPTPYRYQALIERAKRLVELAAQMETAMLSAVEKFYAEAFQVLKARQDIRLADAGVRLQELRVREAQSGVKLAELQQQRAEIERQTYEEWINAGLNQYELEMIDAYRAGAQAQIAAAYFQAGLEMASASGPAAPAAALMASGKFMATSLAAAATERAQVAAIYASFERSRQHWELQKALAEQDMAIAGQQVRIAQDRVRVAGQERMLAQMQAGNARDVMNFLANKFTSAELYDWMSGVLERILGYFLQQATATAQVAAQQLAFERQEAPPPFIQADYWESPTEDLGGAPGDGGKADRRGLTGSARLLRDVFQLDQYAFDSDKRKLQLAKTISLAHVAPVEFQRFRETGVIRFDTPMELFDRDFPGHYLRLVKRVRTSVIALIPTTEGIRATLSTTGLSSVVIGSNALYQTVGVKRLPESVALTSPMNATGLFELTPQPGEMLLPFEGMGVKASWELRMPKASNPFDYRTLADVLLTIEYTALDSFAHRQQVIQQLDTRLSADRPFSFRNQFADAWYDLHNPEQTATPMVVRFRIGREDFPPNLSDVKIQHVVLYFARANGASFELPVTYLRLTEQGGVGAVGGGAITIDGLISTRKGNAGSWTAMLGKSPFGDWELALPNQEAMKDRFKKEGIEDILLVVTYKGETPSWPL